jgi:mannose-1-phosphate guanylyltransferase/mannose-6-phosphate isomerase
VAQISCDPDEQGNRGIGAAYTLCDSHDNFVYAPQRPVITVGVKDLLIVDTPDALLVAHSSSVEQVKNAVAELDRLGVSQARLHRRVARPWGAYDAIDGGDRFLVKRITVNPGSALSLQMHHHRAEHWIVVKGTAQVTRGDEVFLLTENQSTYIPLGVKHRLENPGKVPLEMIEVQSGSYLDEDDIVRFSDQYGRA